MNKKLLGLYGLKWNPFAPTYRSRLCSWTRRIESFCWRAEQLVGEAASLSPLARRAPASPPRCASWPTGSRTSADVKVGIVSRPQSGLSDFYREMGDLFGVELSPTTAGPARRVLRERWQAHIDASLSRPVLIVDEAQEMKSVVLPSCGYLSSARLDSHILSTVVLAGDSRLLERRAPTSSRRSTAACACASRSSGRHPTNWPSCSATPCRRPAPSS